MSNEVEVEAEVEAAVKDIPEVTEGEENDHRGALRDIELAKGVIRNLMHGTDDERLQAGAVQNLARRRNEAFGVSPQKLMQQEQALKGLSTQLQGRLEMIEQLQQSVVKMFVIVEYALRGSPGEQARIPKAAFSDAFRKASERGFASQSFVVEDSAFNPEMQIIRPLTDDEQAKELASMQSHASPTLQ